MTIHHFVNMGELHDAVTALLDAFARGISVIRDQRSRRKEERLQVDPVQQTAESHIRRSLKKSRSDVDEAYRRDVMRFGPGFAAGDGKILPLSRRSILAVINIAVSRYWLTFQQTRLDQLCPRYC